MGMYLFGQTKFFPIPSLVGGLLLVLVCTQLSADQPSQRIWTEMRRDAVVRVEYTSKNRGRGVGTAFLVHGQRKSFLLTSAHVLGEGNDLAGSSETCIPFKDEIDFYRREREGEYLSSQNCAWLLGSDIALVPLPDRKGGYPVLELRAREFNLYDTVYLAGYPNGYSLDPTRWGTVSSVRGEKNLVVTNTLTMEGMSGGPYLSTTGYVVGIHNGGVLHRSGFAQFTSVKRVRDLLEPFLGALEEEQAIAPDAQKVANDATANAGLGALVALRAVQDPLQRLKLWETFLGEPPTAAESTIIKALPTALVKGLPADVVNVLENTQQQDRLVIGNSLNAISVASQKSCLSKPMKIVDGILQCDGVSNYLPTEKMGGKINPELIVLHSTMTKGLQETVSVLLKNSLTASVHFLVDRDGSIVQLVPTDRAAWHAGVNSSWEGLTNLNNSSVSIDFINLGQLDKNQDGSFTNYEGLEVPADDVQMFKGPIETSYWHRFTGPQLVSAQALATELSKNYKIRAIVGHCTVSPGRKTDPGPVFPMNDFSQAVLGRDEPGCRPGEASSQLK